jgi:intergrase/recombinase
MNKEVPPEGNIKKEGITFETRKKIRGYDVSVSLGKDNPPTANVDFDSKKVDVQLTPEVVAEGVRLLTGFLSEQGVKTKSTLQKWSEAVEEKRAEIQKGTEKAEVQKAKQDIGRYAKERGISEEEALKELLEELENQK